MRYVRLYPDSRGETHFADAELAMQEADYRPPAPLMFVSRAHGSNMIQFVRLPKGWVGEAIQVPQPQFFICVEGRLRITASDGETRAFKAGDVVLMEDNSGRGHTTRVDAGQECVAAIAPVLD